MPTTNKAIKNRNQKAQRLATKIAPEYPRFNRKQLLQQARFMMDIEAQCGRHFDTSKGERAGDHGQN